MIDVQTARSDIGSYEQVNAALAEARQDAFALVLRQATMQRFGAPTARTHGFSDFVHSYARTAEHDGRGRRLHVQHACQRLQLVRALDHVGHLLDALHLFVLVALACDGDAHRVLEVVLRQAEDALGHRGREQRCLAACGRARQDRFQVIGEAHVEHLVRFVEHHAAHLREIHGAARQVIHRAARGRNHHGHTAVQHARLLTKGRTAIDRQHAGAQGLAVLVHGLGDLHGQLARRHQHERARLVALQLHARCQVQQRQGKGRRLARACRRLAQQVAARQQHGDGLALDGRGFLIAQRRHCGREFRLQTQRCESGRRSGLLLLCFVLHRMRYCRMHHPERATETR